MEDVEQKVGLEPCPFCGSEASDTGMTKYSRPLEDSWWEDGTPVERAYFVNCLKCFATTRGLVGGQQTQEKAIAAWNRRTPSAKLAEVERGWLPIESAPKDGSYILAVVAPNDSRHMQHQAGRVFSIRHEGYTENGFDLGWAVYPGYGGAPDQFFSCWAPQPLTPSAAIERAGE